MRIVESVAHLLLRHAVDARGRLRPLRLFLPAMAFWPMVLLALGWIQERGAGAGSGPRLVLLALTVLAVFSTTGALLALWLHGRRDDR